MTLFLDTNILLDLLAKREPFAKFAYAIFEKATKGSYVLWTSSNSITQVYRILENKLDTRKAKDIVLHLLHRINIKVVDKSILRLSAESDFNEMDDAIQYFCAASIDGIDYIITRNIKNYQIGRVRVMGPDRLFY